MHDRTLCIFHDINLIIISYCNIIIFYHISSRRLPSKKHTCFGHYQMGGAQIWIWIFYGWQSSPLCVLINFLWSHFLHFSWHISFLNHLVFSLELVQYFFVWYSFAIMLCAFFMALIQNTSIFNMIPTSEKFFIVMLNFVQYFSVW